MENDPKPFLTKEEALAILEPPLRFGDPTQIQAVRALELIEEETKRPFHMAFCQCCQGEGTVTCDECEGTGKEKVYDEE